MKKFVIISFIILFLISCTTTKMVVKDIVTIKYVDADPSELPAELSLINDPRSGMWSIMFYDLDKDLSLFDYNSNRNLLPASNLKLLSTAAAIKVLGPDYRFNTDLFYTGEINKKLNLLEGDIIVVGSGDPTIGHDYFRDPSLKEFDIIADSLRTGLGIDYIKGKIRIHNPVTHDKKYGKGWDLDDLPYYYSAPISPVSFNENLTRIYIKDNVAEVIPDYPFTFKLDTVYGIEKTEFTRVIGTDSVIVISDFDRKVRGHITVNDPEKLFTRMLKDHLNKNGISVLENEIIDSTVSIVPLCKITSDSLFKMVKKCNSESNNFYTEQLFRETAKIFSADTLVSDSLRNIDLTYDNILKLNSELYSRLFGLNNFDLMDGSGLSRRNFFSAEKFIDVLRTMYNDIYFITYLSSFPNPGKNGTLEYKFIHPDLNGRLFCKTGSMTGVNNITGYLITKKNNRIAFSILNNYYNWSRGISNRKLEDILLYFVNNY